MPSVALKKAIAASADPQRALGYVEQLEKNSAHFPKKFSTEQAQILASLLSGSQASSELLVAHPDWLATVLDDDLRFARRPEGLRRTAKQLIKGEDYETSLARLREFKQREFVRIAARDLGRIGNMTEIIREISHVADVCLALVCDLCTKKLTERFGAPWHQDADGQWQPTQFCTLGMGKLGGQELNYSSDIDVLFVYSEEGHLFQTPPKPKEEGRGMTSHQFFIKLAELIISEIGKLTPEGMLFRIDLRLRPEGDSGPLARSLESYENYYAQWGQTWERMMLIKARPVAGDAELGAEFLDMVQSFRYPRSLGERTLPEIAAMKQRIENEVVKVGEMERNVKLGRGGIREIEFIAQTQQLLHAGRTPFLQGAQTLPTLQKLVDYALLSEKEMRELTEAYVFLREVEHRLQMEAYQQTHTIPTDRVARERLAKLMGFATWQKFDEARVKYSNNVRRIYDARVQGDGPAAPTPFPETIKGFEDQWKKLLSEHGFRDTDQALRMVEVFLHGPGYVHVSPRSVELARDLLPRFLALCPTAPGVRLSPVAATWPAPTASKLTRASIPHHPAATEDSRTPLSDPDRVLVRLDNFISAYGTRATLYELWTRSPSLFTLLLLLFDRSEFLAEIAIRTPDLVDELELSGRLRRAKGAEETLEDLRYGLNDEDQHLWLRRYHQAELMRIGLRDILGLADFEQNLVELSALADACLQYAVEVVMRRHKLKTTPFAIIGCGKLGGKEVGYGSDLDIIFVTDASAKKLPPLQKMAAEVMDLLSRQTELGIVFPTDARLRPDGEKGLLVTTLEACGEYYHKRAALWEIQSLSRTRPVAGDLKIGERFEKMTAALPLPSDWKQQIIRMRERIEKERTPAGQDHLAIKTGRGGLMDAEFLAQTICLENRWHEPNTLKALQRAVASGALNRADGDKLLENYRKLRRIEGILRRWSFAGEVLLPDDDAALYRVAVRCGFENSASFMRELNEVREGIRAVYAKMSFRTAAARGNVK